MKLARVPGILASLVFLSTMTACAALPKVATPELEQIKNPLPTVTGNVGELDTKRTRDLIAKRWANTASDIKALALLEETLTGEPLISGNKVTLLFDGPATIQAMMQAVRAATSTINLETYIFDQDEVGLQFANLLIKRRQDGVIVNVLYDAVGTLGTPRAFFERMGAAGINLIAFNPVNPAARKGHWELNNRDHRKLLVVDGKIAFTGGINISETYANSSFFRTLRDPDDADHDDIGWRDTHVQIEGPAVAALQWHFIDAWIRQEGGDIPKADYFPALKPVGTKLLRVLATAPARDSEIYKAFVFAIQEAKQSVHVTSAYFVPDRQFIDALCNAAQRAVDVRLVLPGVTDHGLVFYAGRAFYDELLACGVRIFQLQVAVLHAKTAVIDGTWSTVGSANIDRRSFLHNYELNVVVLDTEFGRAMESAFSEDLKDSKEVTLAQWRKRPMLDRIKEWLARLTEYWI